MSPRCACAAAIPTAKTVRRPVTYGYYDGHIDAMLSTDVSSKTEAAAKHIPVHTVGFGREHMSHDIEIDDALVAPRALADSRLGAVIRFHQRGYAGLQVAHEYIPAAVGLVAHEVVGFAGEGDVTAVGADGVTVAAGIAA